MAAFIATDFPFGTVQMLTPPKSGPLNRPSVPESVAAHMRQSILRGDLRPGERLVEQKFAGLFNVGQPTIREALRLLEGDGFVRKQGNRGTFVTNLSAREISELNEVRMLLETVAIERAAPRLTAEGIADLQYRVKCMKEAAVNLDLSSFHENDMAFHHRIWESCGNRQLAATLDRVASYLFAFVLLKAEPADRVYADSAAQHEKILEGLISKDPAIARRAFEEATVFHWVHHRHLKGEKEE
jgi:DNA-binding GntR family transcriptional regulator